MKLKEALSSLLEDFDDDDPVAQHLGGSYRTKKFPKKGPALTQPDRPDPEEWDEFEYDSQGKPPDPANIFAGGTHGGQVPPKLTKKANWEKQNDRQIDMYRKMHTRNAADKAFQKKKRLAQFTEALPKPGQAPLGGVQSSDFNYLDVLVKGYGMVKVGQLKNMIYETMDNIAGAIPEESENSNISVLQNKKRLLNVFIDALIEVEQKRK